VKTSAILNKNIKLTLIILLSLFFFEGFTQEAEYGKNCKEITWAPTICNYFTPANGYERKEVDKFGVFYRIFAIVITEGILHTGEKLNGFGSKYAAIFDYPIGKKDLHQCADAAIYMRTTFLNGGLGMRKPSEIKWHYTDGTNLSYQDFLNKNNLENGKEGFFSYMENIFIYAGTWSIENYDTKSVSIEKLKIGDMMVEGGFPGHIVSIVDIIENDIGEKLYMLSQSFMPAQSNHILLDDDGDVWFDLNKYDDIIPTPDWTFNKNSFRRFTN